MGNLPNKLQESALKDAFVEGLKYFLRTEIFSVVPLLLGLVLMGINTETGAIAINWFLLRAVFLFQTITALLGAIDKAKHIYGKEMNPDDVGKSFGIVKF